MKSRGTSRILALLLTLTMLLSCMPQALAEEVVVLEEPIVEEAPEIVEEVIVEEEPSAEVVPNEAFNSAESVDEGDAAETADCTHPEEAVVLKGEYVNQNYAVNIGDPSVHYGYGELIEKYICSICGEWIRDVTIDPNFEGRVYHDFVDGVCEDCGYVCPHPQEFIKTEQIVKGSGWYDLWNIVDEEYHSLPGGDLVEQTKCTNCETVFNEVMIKEGYFTFVQKHNFDENGYCATCGLQKPTSPLTMSELTYEVAEGKHFFIDKPVISGGTGKYTIAYNIYDDQGNAVNYFYSDDPRVAASPWANGRYNVFVVVRDGLSEVQKDIGWHALSGY